MADFSTQHSFAINKSINSMFYAEFHGLDSEPRRNYGARDFEGIFAGFLLVFNWK
jgi:hypothetical protein